MICLEKIHARSTTPRVVAGAYSRFTSGEFGFWFAKARRQCSANEGMASRGYAADAVHGRFDAHQRLAARGIIDRPFGLKPIPSLFDCGDCFCVTRFGDGEVQGLAPVDFYHGPDMGIAPTKCKAASGGTDAR